MTWRTDQGIINKQYSNFLVPSISWQNRTRRSRAKITGNPEKLWPLKIGNNERFDIFQVITSNDGSSKQELSRTWQCAVEGTERLTVPAGTFNTFRISCYRYIFDTSYWRQTRTYNYTPKIGHYVAREDIYVNRPNSRRELVSSGFDSRALPESDQATLGQAFQETLNKNRDGAGHTWRSSNGKITAILTPKRTFKGVSGITCRDYTSTYNLGGRTKSNDKRACKQTSGQWQRVALPPTR